MNDREAISQSISACLRGGDIEQLQSLVPSKVSPNATAQSVKLNGITRKDVPLLCIAAGSGSLEAVKYLLSVGAKLEDSDNEGFTVVCWSCFAGFTQILLFLLENGAKPMIDNNPKPLFLATRYGRKECVALLIANGATVKSCDVTCRTPLHIASWFGYTEIVKLLLKAGASVEAQDNFGRMPLHCACWFGHVDCVKSLLEKKAPVNAVTRSNDTPLHFACAHGFADVVRELLDVGADGKIKNEFDKTPEQVAELQERGEILELLHRDEDTGTRKGFVGLDKEFSREQRQLNRTLLDVQIGQDKQWEMIQQLKGKLAQHGVQLSSLHTQHSEMRQLLSVMDKACAEISKHVDGLMPRDASRRFDISRVSSSKKLM